HSNALNPASAITIEAWIRPTALGCVTFVGKNFGAGYWFGYCGGGLRYYYGGGNQVTSGVTIPLNEWSHVAVSYDLTNVRFYLNGEAAGSFFRPDVMPSDNSPMGIGGEGVSATFPNGLFPFEGWMSEVRIWSTARSVDQLRDSLYRQIVVDEPGLVAVWGLEGGPSDRFNEFESTLSELASFSTLDSPPAPTEPLVIRSTSSFGADGICTASDYTTSTRVPQWYPSGDLAFAESNPQEVLIGATASYIFVCLPNRAQLTDPIWFVELDTDNDAGGLDSNDWQFRLWPSQASPLLTRQGNAGVPPLFIPFWENVSNPTGLLALEEPGAEFVGDMEWRIPRSIFPDPSSRFRIRVSHNYLVGAGDNTVTWPLASGPGSPASWEEAVIDLTPVGPPDYRNPQVRTRIANDRPRSSEDVEIEIIASDDVDIELVELMVDGVVVDFLEFTGSVDRAVSFTHAATYPIGTHSYQARAFDHTGREVLSLYKSFRVIVDGEPPAVNLRFGPTDLSPGQTVVLVATATDPSGVDTIWVRDILGISSPSFRRCDFTGTNTTETCTWSVTPPSSVFRLRLDVQAEDSEGYLADSADYIVLFGNTGPDRDDDGLADAIEARLCTDPSDPDTDRDGLGDGWEVQGIRFADGGLEPLVDYGVNPCRRDVLFQMDWEQGSQPPAVTFDNLRNRYRENGIRVYLETNERPRPTAYPQSHIGAFEAAYQIEDGEFYLNPRRLWAFYYGYERALQGRSGASPPFFTMDHFTGSSAFDESGAGGYCTGGSSPGKTCRGDFECPGSGASCVAGCIGGTRDKQSCSARAECPDGDGGFVTCAIPCTTAPGAGGVPCNPINDIPTRLMHELGHAVGLGHGGNTGTRNATADRGFVRLDFAWDNENYKPNHQSIMNYGQWGGALCVEPFPGTLPPDFRPTVVGQINYTDLDQGDLNEAALSESFNSPFARRLRSRNCDLASPTAIPVVEYNCTIGDVAYTAWSDGTRTL
ncbi:MAG: LamG-like jellyroll fold domain-containing protein, partial [Wenzhouxiangellaceae bacterium]